MPARRGGVARRVGRAPTAYEVSLRQPLGRLTFVLLEPRSDDGLLTWNLLDESLAVSTAYPILRVPSAPDADRPGC